MEKQLIIIGNGFDLMAGLKSKYSDFFKWYFSDRDSRYTAGRNKEINFWKELFWERKKCSESEKNMNWSDIESTIEKLLVMIEKDFSEEDYHFYAVMDELTNKVMSLKMNTLKVGISKKEIFVELYNDLKKFEFDFAEFLVNEIAENVKYADNANQLVSELIVREYLQKSNFKSEDEYYEARNTFIDSSSEKTKRQLLSFNYTHETNDRAFINAKVFNNVHGNIADKNIIFGIDGHKLVGRQLLLPFTKTYRMMMNSMERFELTGDIEYIKFFGHGLAEADYSYFQTIFDDVDLYNGNTKLIFYYNVYNEEKRKEIIEEQHLGIVNLIQKYGETLDNKDHGKNMMHKLLLEGRVKMEEIRLKEVLAE